MRIRLNKGAGFWSTLRLEPGKPNCKQQQLLQKKQNSTEIRASSLKDFCGNTARLGKAESCDLEDTESAATGVTRCFLVQHQRESAGV